MKFHLLVCALFCVFFSARANTYYSTNGSAPNLTSSWHSSRNGTGSVPSNFSGTDIFIIQAGHTVTTTGNWSISGSNAKIIIESNAKLQGNDKVIVDKFEMYAGGTFIHNDNTATFPGDVERTLAATSTVEITNWNGSAKLPAPTTWGNLVIDLDGYSSNLNQAGELTDIAGDFTIQSTGDKEFRLSAAQDFTLTIGGNLEIDGGILELSSGNSSALQTIIINGSYIQSGGVFTRSNTKADMLEIQFNGSNSNFTKTGGTMDDTYINWKVNTGKTVTLNNNLSIALLRSLTVNGTLDCDGGNVTGLGSFILNSAGKIITSSTQGLSGCLALTGLLTLNSGGSYQFDSPTTTPFPLSLSSISATNIVIGANVTFNKNVTVTGTLTLNSGKATIPAGNTVTITSGNAISGSGFSSGKHIVTQVNSLLGTMGYLRIQNFTGTRTLPVGTGTYYLPVTLIATGTNDFSTCVYNGTTANGQPNGTAVSATLKKNGVDAVWIVNRNAGSSAVSMQLSWPDALEGSSFSTLADNEIGMAHFSTYWESAFGTGSQSGNTATRTGILSFSPFMVYKGGVPMPLRFGGIKATQIRSGVQVDWYSLSETNVDHYEVERSTNGNNYAMIGKTAAAGNSESRRDYSWKDPITTDGIFFYRIKSIDVDGRINYSSMVKTNVTQQSPAGLLLYPNPVQDKKLTVQAGFLSAGQYKLYVFDQAGSPVYQQSFDHNGGAFTQFIQLPSSIKLGVYTVALNGSQDTRMTKSFVVK
jgi:hypothetical protein